MIGWARPQWAWWHLAVMAVVCVAAMAGRWSFAEMAAGAGAVLSFSDQAVAASLDPYVMIYLVVPVFLVAAMRASARLTDPLVVLRCGSFLRWLALVLLRNLAEAVPLLSSLVAAALASAAGLPLTAGWGALADPTVGYELALVGANGWSPVAVIIVTLLIAGLNLALIGTAIAAAGLVLGRIWVLVVPGIVLLLCVIGFQAGMPTPLLDVSAGVVLKNAVVWFGPTPAAMLLPGLVQASVIAVLLGYRRAQQRGVAGPAVRTAIPLLVVAALLAIKVVSARGELAKSDLFYATFYGVSPSGASLPDYLLLSIVVGAPAYLAIVGFEGVLSGLPERLLRAGSVARLAWLEVRRPAGYMFGYLVAVMGWFLVCSLGPAGYGGAAVGAAPGDMAWQFLVNGTLQCWLYLLVAVAARWFAGRAAAGVSALAVLIAAGFFANGAWWLPSGQNSLGLLDGRSPPILGTAVLIVWISVVALVAAGLLRTAPGQRCLERNLAND